MLCAEWSLVKRDDPQTTVIPLRCKCWTCEECRPIRKARLEHEALAGQPNLFITLTSRNRASITRHQAARDLVAAWRRFRLEFLKRYGKGSLPFLAVFEETKRGWPHLHIVARAKWVDQKWLSNRMQVLIGSPIVDVRRITNQKKIIAYIAKYLRKNPHKFQGVKRYWRSLGYLKPTPRTDLDPDEPPGTWQIVKCSWRTLALWAEVDGFAVEVRRDRVIITPWVPP